VRHPYPALTCFLSLLLLFLFTFSLLPTYSTPWKLQIPFFPSFFLWWYNLYTFRFIPLKWNFHLFHKYTNYTNIQIYPPTTISRKDASITPENSLILLLNQSSTVFYTPAIRKPLFWLISPLISTVYSGTSYRLSHTVYYLLYLAWHLYCCMCPVHSQ
jgi:hypothetical protein